MRFRFLLLLTDRAVLLAGLDEGVVECGKSTRLTRPADSCTAKRCFKCCSVVVIGMLTRKSELGDSAVGSFGSSGRR
jgi:hypothetical protein